MELILIWVACGVAGAMILSNKGRSGVGGFFLGLLLGPIGVVMALVMKSNVINLEEEAIRAGTGRKCPYCAEVVKIEAIICRHCQKELPKRA